LCAPRLRGKSEPAVTRAETHLDRMIISRLPVTDDFGKHLFLPALIGRLQTGRDARDLPFANTVAGDSYVLEKYPIACHLQNRNRYAFACGEQEMTMKKVALVGLTGMMTLACGLVGSAQTLYPTYPFKIKSSFYAGNTKMPAGSYTLRQVEGEQNAYTLENSSGTHSVILETRSSSKASKGSAEVVLNRYGTTEYLEGVETSTGNSIDIIPGIAEKIAAKKATAQPHTMPAN
jgi:hypothetical protein